MWKTLGWLVVVIAIAVFGIVALQYRPTSQSGPQENQITVAATIFPLADIVRQVGGDRVHARLIIPPGVTEHSAALNPQQLEELQTARLIFQIGHGLDTHLTQRITSVLPNVQLVTVDNGISIVPFSKEEGEDPHYWLSVPNALQIATTVTEALVQTDPANADYYRQNLVEYEVKLRELEQELQGIASQLPRREFIAMHNAWSYFSEQYGLQLLDTYEPVEGQQPSFEDLRRLQVLIRDYGLTTFYAEPQKASTSVTELMRRDFGLQVLVLDPVGGRNETGSYMDLMRFNMNAIAAGAK